MCLLSVVAGCSLISKARGKAGLPGGSSSAERSDDDPQEVSYTFSQLESLEHMVKEQQFTRYIAVSTTLYNSMYEPGPDDQVLKSSPKLPALRSRLHAVDMQVAAMAGAEGKRIYGDGKRVRTAKGEAKNLIERAIKHCEAADDAVSGVNVSESGVKTLQEEYTQYEGDLAKAEQADPTILSYFGDINGSSVDVKLSLVLCEIGVADSKIDAEELYVEEKNTSEMKKGCGKQSMMARAVSLGGGKFGPYERGGAGYPEKVACKSIPKKDNIGGHLVAAAKAHKEREGFKQVVFVTDGKPYVREDEDEGRLYQQQDIWVYSPEMMFPQNPCGGSDKIACEAGGSKSVKFYNLMQHHAARAEAHKKAGRVERCKSHLADAQTQWKDFKKMFDDSKGSKTWIEGMQYKTLKGDMLTEADFVKKFETEAKDLDDRAVKDWCATK